METYPIYKAHFGGSSDMMCGTTISVAATNIIQAGEKLRAQQGRCVNNINTGIGVIMKTEGHNMLHADPTAIIRVTDIRATKLNWIHTHTGEFI